MGANVDMNRGPGRGPRPDEVTGLVIGAGERLVALVGRVGRRWATPALGSWDVRSLAGHTVRAFLTIESYVVPGSTAPDGSLDAVDYYRVALGGGGGPVDHDAIARRGRESGAALGDDPVGAIGVIVERVSTLLRDLPGNTLVRTPFGDMALADYLITRLAEVVIHASDLATALGEGPVATADELLVIGGLLVGLAVAGGDGDLVMRALSGRRPLPDGFSALG